MSLSLLSTHRNSRCTWIATYFFSSLNLLIFLLLPVVAFRATKIECLWAEPCHICDSEISAFLASAQRAPSSTHFLENVLTPNLTSPSFPQPWEISSFEPSGVFYTCLIRAPISYLVWMETPHGHCPYKGLTQPPKSIRQNLPGIMRPKPSSLAFGVKSAKFWGTWMFYS